LSGDRSADYDRAMLAGSFLEVVSRFIRIFSVVACLFIVAGLIGLLTDLVRDTSTVQQTRIVDPGSGGQPVTIDVDIETPNPSPAVEAVRESQHTGGREFIDDVNDVLLGPFTFLIEGSDGAVRHLLYSGLGLIFYGLLLQMLADWLRKQSDGARRAVIAAREQAAAEERRKSGQFISPA
jgi:hypothetical protein